MANQIIHATSRAAPRMMTAVETVEELKSPKVAGRNVSRMPYDWRTAIGPCVLMAVTSD